MNNFSIIAILTIITFAAQGQTIDISKYDALTVEQKVEFFGGMSKMRLQNETDFVKALVLGAADSNDAVRRRAAQRAAMSLVGLQQLAQSGQQVPVSPADLGELSKVLSSLLTTADVETRAAAVRGVVALGSPTNATEAMLLRTFAVEQNDELRADMVDAMKSAGYQSETFKRVLIERLDQAKERELEAIFAACAQLRISEALPALIARLGQQGVPQVILLRSIADFGNAASEAKAKLERLIADPSSAHQVEARTALAALAVEAKPPVMQRPFVDLVTTSSSSKDEVAKPSTGVATATKTTSSYPKTRATPTPSVDPASSKPWSIIVVLIVAACGLMWLVLKRRS